MTTEVENTSRYDLEPRAAATVALILAVVVAPDLTERLPLWPAQFGNAPSVGSALLLAALVMALISFSRRQGWEAK
ncbi:MAG: hypothetical protein EON85_01550 [Brevundimonas sp.]|nr:MAG: hypothetical protein EON85_01550 [Brevundimonas sp.]